MRLGGPAHNPGDPASWVAHVQQLGYRAAYCPLSPGADDAEIALYARAAQQANIVIAEIGAWSNPLSSDQGERKAALDKCKAGLELAEKIGAVCCVNIAGSRSPQWDGPHALNLTPETFAMIVAQTREIIDDVAPRRAFYTLETMPWAYPNSPQSYLELMQAIDRPQFAVHLDIVNITNSPERFFNSVGLIRECFELLGPRVVGVHAKDIALAPKLTVHLDEVRPGLGGFDFHTLLREMDKLGPDTPLMLEHLPNEEEYRLAAEHVRGVAREVGVEL